jgi:hypothetical protein
VRCVRQAHHEAAAGDGGHRLGPQRQAQGREADSVSCDLLPHLGYREACAAVVGSSSRRSGRLSVIQPRSYRARIRRRYDAETPRAYPPSANARTFAYLVLATKPMSAAMPKMSANIIANTMSEPQSRCVVTSVARPEASGRPGEGHQTAKRYATRRPDTSSE